jgi:DNA helicase-2/ATP-dependent DNA helicase PcrA
MEYYKTEENRINNINEFIGMLIEFTSKTEETDTRKIILNFINENQLFSASDEEHKGSQIVLSTIHASKGLEYDIVFLTNFNEGILPSKRSSSIKDIEDERRLAYVAITRAKKQLYISCHEGYDYSNNL